MPLVSPHTCATHAPLRGCRHRVLVPPGRLVRVSSFQIMKLSLLPHSNGKQTWAGSLQHYSLNSISKERSQEWGDTAVKSSCFSSRELEFGSWHPHWKSQSQLYVTPAAGVSHSSASVGTCTSGHTQNFKNNTNKSLKIVTCL